MKLHINTLFLAVFFAFATLELQAQEKYEYLIIEARDRDNSLYISKGGTELKRLDFDKTEVFNIGVVNLALREVQKREDEGWELFDSDFVVFGGTNPLIFYYYKLRKKR